LCTKHIQKFPLKSRKHLGVFRNTTAKMLGSREGVRNLHCYGNLTIENKTVMAWTVHLPH